MGEMLRGNGGQVRKQRYLFHAHHGMKAGGRSKFSRLFLLSTSSRGYLLQGRYLLCLPSRQCHPPASYTQIVVGLLYLLFFHISRAEQSRHHTNLKSPCFWNPSYFVGQRDCGANSAGSSYSVLIQSGSTAQGTHHPETCLAL